MASTYSPNLRLELIGTGEQQGTWGSTTNTNLGTLLEEAIGGYVSVAVSDVADTTLTTSNGSADQSRNMVINLTGALTGTRNVICPAIEKLYVVKNATTGGQSIVFKVSGQTGVTVPNGLVEFIYVDGTDARSITGSIAVQDANNVSITGGSITGITDLAVADGGTGASNASSARTNLGIGTLGTQNANAVAITGGSVVANASSLSIRDSDGSNILTFAVGSNLTANTILTLTTGATSNRTFDISATDVTITTAGAALIDDTDAAAQRTTLGLGTAATLNVGTSANNVVQLNSSAQLPAVDGSLLTGISGTPTGTVTEYAGLTEPSGWVFCYGQSVSRTTYASLFAVISKNSTVTITIASPGVITWNSHGLAANDPVTFNTTGALPTGLTAGTTYYVISAGLATNTFQVSTTIGGAAVNTSGTQSGTHTAFYVPYGVASTTTFNIPDMRGRSSSGRDNMGGSAANRVTSGGSGINGTTLGAVGGAETHTLTTAQLASHTHSTNTGTGGGQAGLTSQLNAYSGNTQTGSSGSGNAHNNMQPTIMFNYIIKT